MKSISLAPRKYGTPKKRVLCERCGEWCDFVFQSQFCKVGHQKQPELLEYDRNNIVHVYPVQEGAKHYLEGLICPCGASVEIQFYGGVLVKHKALLLNLLSPPQLKV